MKSKVERKESFDPVELTITLENKDELHFVFELLDIRPSTYKEWRKEEYPLTADFNTDNIDKNDAWELLEQYIEDTLPF